MGRVRRRILLFSSSYVEGVEEDLFLVYLSPVEKPANPRRCCTLSFLPSSNVSTAFFTARFMAVAKGTQRARKGRAVDSCLLAGLFAKEGNMGTESPAPKLGDTTLAFAFPGIFFLSC